MGKSGSTNCFRCLRRFATRASSSIAPQSQLVRQTGLCAIARSTLAHAPQRRIRLIAATMVVNLCQASSIRTAQVPIDGV